MRPKILSTLLRPLLRGRSSERDTYSPMNQIVQYMPMHVLVIRVALKITYDVETIDPAVGGRSWPTGEKPGLRNRRSGREIDLQYGVSNITWKGINCRIRRSWHDSCLAG